MAEGTTAQGGQCLGCLISAGIIAVILYSCSPEPTPEQLKRDADIERIVEGRMQVQDLLKDPDSADFSNERMSPSGVYCASVNAKNSFGGYAGPSRAMASREIALIEAPENSAEFQRLWSSFC